MERTHIVFFGPTNSGKSTLVNAIAGQQVSLVSPVPGTTTDPVRKLIELPYGIGPAVLIDTAGFDDDSVLGAERRRMTFAVLDEADIAVIVSPAGVPDSGTPEAFVDTIRSADIPVVLYSRGESVDDLLRRIATALPPQEDPSLTGDLVTAGDTVLLVMPQDSEAPKGRLILPQVQVLRELLDRDCTPLCCTPDSLSAALSTLKELPALTITDASVFQTVNAALPPEAPLTAFSVLLAAAKGDAAVFVEGARTIDRLTPTSRVLIAEACTHVPDTEDIGREKIPALLRQRVQMPGQARHDGGGQPVHVDDGKRNGAGGILGSEHFSCSLNEIPERSDAQNNLTVDISAGNDFPEDLSTYDLIIHCGACVAGKSLVRARIRKALRSGVPITNYGIALAYLQGMLDRIVIPGSRTR